MTPRNPCATPPQTPSCCGTSPSTRHAVCVRPKSFESYRLLDAGIDDRDRHIVAARRELFDDRIVEPQVFRRVPDEQDPHEASTRLADVARRTVGNDATSSGTSEAPPSIRKMCWATYRCEVLKVGSEYNASELTPHKGARYE